MHSSNLNDLDALTRKLKESMHVLDAVGESPTIIPRRQIDEESLDSRDGVPQVNTHIQSREPFDSSFGKGPNDFIAGAHTTYKTDLQKATMTQQIKDFREEHLKKKKVVDNPFASQDALGQMVIPATPAEEPVQQPLEEVESQTNTLNQTEEVKIEHSLRKREPSEAKTDSPAFGNRELEQEESQSRTKIDFDNVNYDEEEMKWLEKIVKK